MIKVSRWTLCSHTDKALLQAQWGMIWLLFFISTQTHGARLKCLLYIDKRLHTLGIALWERNSNISILFSIFCFSFSFFTLEDFGPKVHGQNLQKLHVLEYILLNTSVKKRVEFLSHYLSYKVRKLWAIIFEIILL